MEVLYFQKKGALLNTIERFYIHKEVTNNNHLNEDYVETSNQIFNTIIKQLNNMAINIAHKLQSPPPSTTTTITTTPINSQDQTT